jgi:hypothetical protein
LEQLWQDLRGKPALYAEIHVAHEACMQAIPECVESATGESRDGFIWKAAGESALSALAYALRCRQNGSANEAAWAAECAYEAIDHFVVNTENVEINIRGEEERVLHHPLIQAEFARQVRDLTELRQSAVTLELVCQRAKEEAWVFLPPWPA